MVLHRFILRDFVRRRDAFAEISVSVSEVSAMFSVGSIELASTVVVALMALGCFMIRVRNAVGLLHSQGALRLRPPSRQQILRQQ